MSAETIRQIDLFIGEVVDNRTRTQKQADREREKPQQTELFAQREIAQFGVRANPHLPLSEHTKLVLIREDPRTEEEIERDRMLEAQSFTDDLFVTKLSTRDSKEIIATQPVSVIQELTEIIGYRAMHRRMSVLVRTRRRI